MPDGCSYKSELSILLQINSCPVENILNSFCKFKGIPLVRPVESNLKCSKEKQKSDKNINLKNKDPTDFIHLIFCLMWFVVGITHYNFFRVCGIFEETLSL